MQDNRCSFAWWFACEAHAGQIGKDGQPYTDHLRRVMVRTHAKLARLDSKAMNESERTDILCAALLHDTLEDTHTTLDALERAFPPRVVALVQGLTRPAGPPSGTTYHEWIEDIAASGDLGLIMIKLSDNEDNADPARIDCLPRHERSIARRYERSMRILRLALARITIRLVDKEGPRAG